MAENKYYKKIVEFLSKKKFATRSDIAKHLKIQQGGSLTDTLTDLNVCSFIKKYTPYNLNDQSKLGRYCTNDSYLQFFYKFIKPLASRIDNGDFELNPCHAMPCHKNGNITKMAGVFI